MTLCGQNTAKVTISERHIPQAPLYACCSNIGLAVIFGLISIFTRFVACVFFLIIFKAQLIRWRERENSVLLQLNCKDLTTL